MKKKNLHFQRENSFESEKALKEVDQRKLFDRRSYLLTEDDGESGSQSYKKFSLKNSRLVLTFLTVHYLN